MIVIHTRSTSILSKEFWKWVARKVTKKYSGPNAVEDSLLRGLKKLGVSYTRNAEPNTDDTLVVLSGVQALSKAITLKQRGIIKKLIAGPNIVASPTDGGGIMLNKEIDIVLVPAEWVLHLWKHEAPELESKLRIWASGVPIYEASNRSGKPIIYDKLNNSNLLNEVKKATSNGIVFTYGLYKQADYLEALKTAPYLIYLAESESQGLALQEAWAHDVPTFVNKSTTWQSGGRRWESNQINCPYLTEEEGAVFNNVDELVNMIENSRLIHPKRYCDNNLSDVISTKNLLDLVYEKND